MRDRVNDSMGLNSSDLADAMSYMTQAFRTMGSLFESGSINIPDNPILSSAIRELTEKKIEEKSKEEPEKGPGKSRYEILLEDTEGECSDQS